MDSRVVVEFGRGGRELTRAGTIARNARDSDENKDNHNNRRETREAIFDRGV